MKDSLTKNEKDFLEEDISGDIISNCDMNYQEHLQVQMMTSTDSNSGLFFVIKSMT